jgi:hypothetical protein
VVGSSNIFLNRYILPSNYILPSMPPISKKKLFTKLYIILNVTGKWKNGSIYLYSFLRRGSFCSAIGSFAAQAYEPGQAWNFLLGYFCTWPKHPTWFPIYMRARRRREIHIEKTTPAAAVNGVCPIYPGAGPLQFKGIQLNTQFFWNIQVY